MLLADEAERRRPIVSARRNREEALSGSVAAAQQEVRMLSDRLHPLDDLIKLREERVNALRKLMTTGMVGRLVLIQAQSEFADAEQRRRDAVSQHAMAQQRVALVEQERAKLQADTRSNLEIEITAVEQQIAANERELATSEGVLGTLTPTRIQHSAPSGEARFAYEIVHATATGPVARASDGMTILQPGDLVRIIPNERSSAREDRPTIAAPVRDVSVR